MWVTWLVSRTQTVHIYIVLINPNLLVAIFIHVNPYEHTDTLTWQEHLCFISRLSLWSGTKWVPSLQTVIICTLLGHFRLACGCSCRSGGLVCSISCGWLQHLTLNLVKFSEGRGGIILFGVLCCICTWMRIFWKKYKFKIPQKW